MTTPTLSDGVSPEQEAKLLKVLGKKLERQEMQSLIEHGDMVIALAKARRKADIDMTDFMAVLHPYIPWTDPESYGPEISRRALHRGWKINIDDFYKFEDRRKRLDVSGRYTALSIGLNLGSGLAYNLSEALIWLETSLSSLGWQLIVSDLARRAVWRSGSAMKYPVGGLKPVALDLKPSKAVYDHLRDGSVHFPALEVLWLLALNPLVLTYLPEAVIPELAIAGLHEKGMPNNVLRISVKPDSQKVFVGTIGYGSLMVRRTPYPLYAPTFAE